MRHRALPAVIAPTFTSHKMYLFGAFFLLFAHWGSDEYLSVQFAFFVLAAIKLGPYFVSRSINIFFALSAAGLFIALSLAAGHDGHMMLVGLRTALIMSLLFVARRAFSQGTRQQAAARGGAVMRALTVACVVSLVVAAGQLLDSLGPNTGLFDVPAKFFALDYGTFLGERRSALSKISYFIRPSAFYSEPSSLALLGNISLLVGLLGVNKRLILLGLLTVIVSYSVSGFLICIFIIGYFFFILDRGSNSLVTRSQLVVIGGVVFLVGMALLGERISNIGNLKDQSALIRVFEPIQILMQMLHSGEYFGLPPESLLRRMSLSVFTIFDNWIMNQLLYYGVFGVIPITLLFYCFGMSLGVIVLVLGFTNGDLFYYDRLIFLMLLIVAVSSFKRARGQVQ